MGCMWEPTCSINCTVSTILTLLHLIHVLQTLDKVYSTNYITLPKLVLLEHVCYF